MDPKHTLHEPGNPVKPPIITRLYEFISHEGLSPYAFYTKAKLANSYLEKTKSVGSNVIEKIHSVFPHLNIEWVLFGEGKMIKIDEHSPKTQNDSDFKEKYLQKLEEMNQVRIQLDQARQEIQDWTEEDRIKQALIYEKEKEISTLKKKIKELEKELATISNVKNG